MTLKNRFDKIQFLNGNTLKLIALVIMTIDHLGFFVFNNNVVMRDIGRAAFPIFAFFIAEGCHYTRSITRYFLNMLSVTLVIQAVMFFVGNSLYLFTTFTFSMSILLIMILKKTAENSSILWAVIFVLTVAALFCFCTFLPDALKEYGFSVDYGFWGIMLPVFVYLPYLFEEKWFSPWLRLIFLLLGQIAVCISYISINVYNEFFSLIALILLALYNGKRGKVKLKYFFYIYYPLHLGILYLIG